MIKRYIEGLIQTHGCNLNCSYCYLKQKEYECSQKKSLNYPLETVLKACSRDRLEGVCMVNLVGDGETLYPEESISLVLGLIEEGHYVNVVTNGTLTKRIQELSDRAEKINKGHLMFSLSFHYAELKKRKLLDVFFANVEYLKEKNVSFTIKMVLGGMEDEAEEVKKLCLKKAGAYPQVAIARKENADGTVGIYTEKTKEEYYKIGDGFHSELFELCKQEFGKKRTDFCYAGSWLFGLNFTTGLYTKCLSNDGDLYDFFEHPEEKPKLTPVGNLCNRPYCTCSNYQAWLAGGGGRQKLYTAAII
ncbi:MAG: radical SAM protein [Acetivibrio ethanolgignens]